MASESCCTTPTSSFPYAHSSDHPSGCPPQKKNRNNPERLQGILQMASLMRDVGGPPGANPFDGARGGGFPAPGIPSTGTTAASNATTATPGAPAPAAGAAPVNPWTSFFPPAGGAAPAGSMGSTTTPPLMNPFGLNPALLQSMMDPGGGGGFGGAWGGATAAPPTDARPPEERFQVQLQVCILPAICVRAVFIHRVLVVKQLQDMGFTNASQNVRALLATGGNVHSAIEYILGGGGL